LTDEDRASIAARSEASIANNLALEQILGELFLGQPVRAGQAVSEAYSDPSIANMTNAGVQSAIAGFRPIMAGKVALGGLGIAGANDLLMSEANAQAKKRTVEAVATATLPGLSDEQNSEYNSLQQRLRAANFGGGADRRAVERRVEQLRKLSDDYAGARNASRQSEYDAAVKRAETARDTIMADRPKKFSDTSVGQVYDKLGVVAPGVIAAGMGGLTRAGLMAAGHSGKIAAYAAPMSVGAATGGISANYPLGHELMFAPAMNPEKIAYSAYARELPPDHPRRQEWMNYAQGLEPENPARRAASNEFYDPLKFTERTAFGAVEGVLGGLAGSEAVGIATRPFRRTPRAPANSSAQAETSSGLQRGANPPEQLPAVPAEYASYGALPSASRDAVQQAFVADRALRGQPIPPKQGAQAIKQSLANQGVNIPVTSQRVAATNAAIDEFVSAYGRLPTAAEFAKVFGSKTLALPLGLGVGASMYGQGD
jgi:hypothetical protein